METSAHKHILVIFFFFIFIMLTISVASHIYRLPSFQKYIREMRKLQIEVYVPNGTATK